MVQSEDAVSLNEISFSSLDPRDSLSLRIDHERVSGRSGNHDTVLNGKLISGQTLKIPLANGGIIDEELSQLHIVSSGNTSANQVLVEKFSDELRTEI